MTERMEEDVDISESGKSKPRRQAKKTER
jgi:hypothetical protein